jgi:hypothetical protein
MPGKIHRPQYYNFTTDASFDTWKVDIEKLRKACDVPEYDKQKLKSYDGFMWWGDDNQTMLNWYLRSKSTKLYDPESYLIDQLDQVQSIEYINYKKLK